jgi:hypothetical protein
MSWDTFNWRSRVRAGLMYAQPRFEATSVNAGRRAEAVVRGEQVSACQASVIAPDPGPRDPVSQLADSPNAVAFADRIDTGMERALPRADLHAGGWRFCPVADLGKGPPHARRPGVCGEFVRPAPPRRVGFAIVDQALHAPANRASSSWRALPPGSDIGQGRSRWPPLRKSGRLPGAIDRRSQRNPGPGLQPVPATREGYAIASGRLPSARLINCESRFQIRLPTEPGGKLRRGDGTSPGDASLRPSDSKQRQRACLGLRTRRMEFSQIGRANRGAQGRGQGRR